LFAQVSKQSRWASLVVAGLLVYPNDLSQMFGLGLAALVFAKNYFDSRRELTA
jgi:hypothetical protein